MTTDNPLLTNYETPPLDKIKPEHFVPAIDHVIAEATKEFHKLAEEKSTPTFQNTVVPIDGLFADIERIKQVLELFTLSKQSPEFAAAAEHVSQEISNFKKIVYQNQALAGRFQKVAKLLSETKDDDKTLYKKLSDEFEGEGAFLSPEGQRRIQQIDNRLIALYSDFSKNLNTGQEKEAVYFNDPQDIVGIPEDVVSGLRENAQQRGDDTGWLVKAEGEQVAKLLAVADNREFRKKIYEAQGRVGTDKSFDDEGNSLSNELVVKEIQSLRYERARLHKQDGEIKYPDYAAYALSRTMTGSVSTAKKLMEAVTAEALPQFEKNVKNIQDFASARRGPPKLEPWDISYWMNRYKQDKFKFDSREFSEYLPLSNVTNGFFETAGKLFNVNFTEEKTGKYPIYHEGVKTYEVTNKATGKLLGIIYADFFARANKDGGAWASQLQRQSPEHKQPSIVTLNLNLINPGDGKDPLLSQVEMETVFHEGGHAMHGLLGTNTVHPSLQGPFASSDYNEFFSTVLENWTKQEDVLNSFAHHHSDPGKTDPEKKMPKKLFQAMKNASTFCSELWALRAIKGGQIDLDFHSDKPYTTSEALEKSADFKSDVANLIPSHKLNRFSHIFSPDCAIEYAAKYNSYLVARALSELGYKPFEKNPFDPDASQRLTELYRPGASSYDKMAAFSEYLGKKRTPEEMAEAMAEAMLQSIGIDKHQPALAIADGRRY